MKLQFKLLGLMMAIGAVSVVLRPVSVASVPAGEPGLDIAQTAAEPLASVNNSRPIAIEVINAGGATITTRLTQPASAERVLPPGSRTTFGTTTTSYLPLPIYLLAYPSDSQLGLSMDISVNDNLVTVIVGEQLSEIPGRTTVRIDQNGGVYAY